MFILRQRQSYWVISVLCVLALLTGAVSTARAAGSVSPPFTQCPAINDAASCDILLSVNADNSITVYGDSSQPPYDGSDDTTVGIVNNSASPVNAVTVMGPGSDLAGFDGDGICTYTGWAGASSCPYGPTGYEGPGTSFVTDPSLPDDAEIDFAGGVVPGGTAYFSLEGALTAAQVSAREGTLGSSFPCPAVGNTNNVKLPELNVGTIKTGKPYVIDYAQLPLTFITGQPQGTALCTVGSTAPGALSVSVQFGSVTIPVSTSTAGAFLNFLPANDPSTNVPTCDFSLVDAVGGPAAVPNPSMFSTTNNCLLLASAHPAGGIIAQWHTPGFAVTSLGGVTVDVTRPLTYYLDLSTIPGLDMSASPDFTTILQDVETYVHVALVTNLPMIDKMVMFQDPPAHLTVTDPLGRAIGFSRDKSGYSVTPGFPQAGYAEAGGRSVAWILEPVPGNYQVTASGPGRSAFNTDVSVLEFLGHGVNPVVQDTLWSGTLGRDGTASKTFTVAGSPVQPVLAPSMLVGKQVCDGRTTVTVGQPVSFTLGHSEIPMGLATATWSFGDGMTAPGDKAGSATHAYTAAGTYTPSLTVTDSLGDMAVFALPAVAVHAPKAHGSDGHP
jgi:hypothetical protein